MKKIHDTGRIWLAQQREKKKTRSRWGLTMGFGPGRWSSGPTSARPTTSCEGRKVAQAKRQRRGFFARASWAWCSSTLDPYRVNEGGTRGMIRWKQRTQWRPGIAGTLTMTRQMWTMMRQREVGHDRWVAEVTGSGRRRLIRSLAEMRHPGLAVGGADPGSKCGGLPERETGERGRASEGSKEEAKGDGAPT